MKKHLITLPALAALAVLTGCSLIPEYKQPAAPVDAAYPQGEAYRTADAAGGSANNAANGAQVPPAADLGWQDYFADARLRRLIAVALENNRDLRVAALNMEAYRAQYRIQRADLFPTLDATASGTRQSTPADLTTTGNRVTGGSYSVQLATTSWELDLFGRIRSLSSSALERYFGSQEAVRSTQIALVANVANAYLSLRADQALLKLTRDTLGTYERSYGLTKRSYDEGISSRLDLRQAQTSVETARASQQRYMRQVAQDENALLLLLGAGRMPDDLPPGLDINQSLFAEVPAGLPSDLLHARPDILSAEHQLLAANADIGAARAAFFPSITLTASAGTASSQLSGLFDAASGAWAFSPRINLPLFTAGALKASLDYAKIQKDINVATYERTIQTAFREVSDGLAARGTYVDQLQAQSRLVDATQDYYKLADERFRSGVDNFLTVLDAQRQLFNAQQILIADRLNQLSSEVNLYKALGGGWKETTAVPTGPLPGTPAGPAMPAS